MKTALVTGATSGLGKAIAVGLSRSGWRVLWHGRNKERTYAASENCECTVPYVADLSHLGSTRLLTDKIRTDQPTLDAIILNAGTITSRREETAEGIERMLAVNHLAPHLLVKELHTLLTKGGRILSISTEAHRWIKGIDLQNLQAEKKFRVLNHYATTKSAGLLTMPRWNQLLTGKDIHLTAHHPGEVSTGFGLKGPWWLKIFWRLKSRRFLTAESAAEPLVEFLNNNPPKNESGLAYYLRNELARAAAFTEDTDIQNAVWEYTEKTTDSILSHPENQTTLSP